MLATIRDKATGWIAGVIVGLLIISFAFWGVSFYSCLLYTSDAADE